MLLKNRFQILQKLGQGGFGETFLAEDNHMLSRRRCVVKQLKLEANDQQSYDIALEQFQKEAEILEKLNHDQIPTLYGYFEEGGQFYLVQKWIEGQTLGEKVRETGPLKQEEVEQILLSLLPVLEYVHSNKVIHRDIKPDNIILRQQDGKPVLIDFGSVKQSLKTAIQASGIQCSKVIGSEGFMPLEQSAGRPINYSSDLYSLGMTAIYLLTGKLPQQLESNFRTNQILWHKYAPSVTLQLAAVLDKVTQFNPSDRYSTASEMLKALETPAFVSSSSTEVSAATSSQTQTVAIPSEATSVGRNPWWFRVGIAAAFVAASVVAGAAGSYAFGLWQAKQSENAALNNIEELFKQGKYEKCQAEARDFPEDSASFSKAQEWDNKCQLDLAKQLKLQGKTKEAIHKAMEVPPDSDVGRDAQKLIANWSAVSLGKQIDTVRKRFGQAPTEKRRPSNWPKTWQPIGLNEDPIRWLDPWRESYEVIPGKMTLGVIFECRSKEIEQKDVFFAQSVELQLMQTKLNQMLEGSATEDIQWGLEQVYQRQANRYPFKSGKFRGLIERDAQDHIRIAVQEV